MFIDLFFKLYNMKEIVTFLFLFLASLSFGQEVKYVYSSTTAGAIDELNSLVTNYEERKKILIRIKKLEESGKVILSSKEFEPIQKRIINIPVNPKDEAEIEMSVYAREAKYRYVLITDLIKE